MTFPLKSISFNINSLRALSLNSDGAWKRAVRVRLETGLPPVFGKEMENRHDLADILNTGTGFSILRQS